MGWTFTPSMNQKTDLKLLIAERIAPGDLSRPKTPGDYSEWVKTGRHATIKHCIRGMCLWRVVEHRMDGGKVERYIALDLLRYGGRQDGWGYKDICESMGPAEISCPVGYLDMVPVADGEYAAPWREKVRAYGRRKSYKFKPGDVVTMLPGYSAKGNFQVKNSRPLRAVHIASGMLYRLKRTSLATVNGEAF